MAKSVLPGLFLLYGMIADRVSDAVAGVIAQMSMRNLAVLVTVTLAFALVREAIAGENRRPAVQSETLLRTLCFAKTSCGSKITN